MKTSTCRADPLNFCLLKRETIPLILHWFPTGEKAACSYLWESCWVCEGPDPPAQCSREQSPRGLDTGVKRGWWAKQRPPSSQGSTLFTYLSPCGLLMSCAGCCLSYCAVMLLLHSSTGGGALVLLHLVALAQGLNQNLCHQRADASLHPHCTPCTWFRMKSVHCCAMTAFKYSLEELDLPTANSY